MKYKYKNGGVVKLQNAWRRVPTPEEIEQVPAQVSTTSVRTAPVEAQFKTVRRKPTESEKNAEEIARIILEEIANKSTGRASGIGNRDLPLQNEYPELMLIPATAEIKAARNIGTGLLRTAAGTIVGDEMARDVANLGQKIDNALSTRIFTPTFGFIGGLGGYALGSNMIGGIASRFRLPRKYRVESINEKTYFAEDQTPKYNSSQITGHFGKVKYYGPTMGKTTAVTSNPILIDFDDIIRQPSRTILDRYGFRNKSEMYNSGNQEAIKAYEDMLVKTLQDWRANPENVNLTLVASPTAIANPANTGFYFDNVPSIPSRDVFITRNVGRGGTPEASAMWYDSLMERNPNLKIDNRFVSEIEKLPYQTPKMFQLQLVPQRAFTSNIPIITKENAASISDAQWDAAYNEAIHSGNMEEAQRLRDLHFVTKSNTKVINENGTPLSVTRANRWGKEPESFTIFDENVGGNWRGFYFTNKSAALKNYGDPTRNFFLNIKNPDTSNNFNVLQGDKRELTDFGYDGMIFSPDGTDARNFEVKAVVPQQIKLADPITRDNSGQIIPLSQRDNFGNPDIRYSMGNQTNLDPNRYTNIDDILKDFQTGKQHALGYLKSVRKQNTDAHNQQLFKRRLRDKVPIEMELKIEENPYLRASTPMQKPNFHYNDATGSWEGEIQLIDGKWIGKDDNGFFLSNLDGNEYGKTAIIDRIQPYTDQMYLDKKADIDDSAFHEYLHRGRIANANDKVGEEFYKWKTKWLMKPTARPYLMKPEEAAANLLEIGRRAGVHTMEYPGQTKAREIIQKIINEDPVKGNMLNETRWETKPKRVWSALRGEYMGLVPLSGLGLGLMNNDK